MLKSSYLDPLEHKVILERLLVRAKNFSAPPYSNTFSKIFKKRNDLSAIKYITWENNILREK